MNPRAEYLLQIIDKIGGPLVAALAHARGADDGESLNPEVSAREDAQAIAQLLARSVQMSIEIGRVMELDLTDQQEADRMRLALMVLAGPLIAGQYKADGRVPGDIEQKKMMTGLEAVLAFSQNFSASAENAASLSGVEKIDEAASLVQAMRHFTPVINAVGQFPFGQPEKKLIQDVSSRITARAEEMARDLLGDPSPADKLLIVRSLAEMYAECHAEEMRLMLSKGQDDPDVQQGLDNVWIRFNLRASMLEALAENLAPSGVAPQSAPAAPPEETAGAQAAPAAAPAPQAPAGFDPMAMFAKKDKDAAPPVTDVPATAAPPAASSPPPPPASTSPAATEPPAPPGGFNPMAMFAKKEDGDPAEPASPPAAPAPAQPPAAVPPPVSEPQAPPSAPPEEGQSGSGESGDGGGSDEGSGGGSSSPMSFFKK